MPKAEGKKITFKDVQEIDQAQLETLPYHNTQLEVGPIPQQWIKYTTREFSAVCPFSGLPDIGEVIIEYLPKDKIVELKSLKYYFISYRNVGIYQEHVTQKIFSDLQKILAPKRLIITTIYNTRGGIDSTCKIDSDIQ